MQVRVLTPTGAGPAENFPGFGIVEEPLEALLGGDVLRRPVVLVEVVDVVQLGDALGETLVPSHDGGAGYGWALPHGGGCTSGLTSGADWLTWLSDDELLVRQSA